MVMFVTKKEMVYEGLKKQILDGELKPGDKLVISKIASVYQVSDIPVREALQKMEKEGLVFSKPHVGSIVAPMSKKEIINIFQIRASLEGLATRLAIPNIPKHVIDELCAMVDDEVNYISNGDTEGYKQSNYVFHTRIYQYADNERLYEMIIDLWDNTKRYPSPFTKKSNMQASHDEHLELIKMIKAGDAARAEAMEIVHKQRAMEAILLLIEQQD